MSERMRAVTHAALTVTSWVVLPVGVALGSVPVCILGGILLVEVYVDAWIRGRA